MEIFRFLSRNDFICVIVENLCKFEIGIRDEYIIIKSNLK